MSINIDYNGSIASCTINGKQFNKCTPLEKAFVLDAFRIIEEYFNREKKLNKNNNFNPEDVFLT